MKIKAFQADPSYQESGFHFSDYDDVVFLGSREYTRRNSDEFDRVEDRFDDVIVTIDDEIQLPYSKVFARTSSEQIDIAKSAINEMFSRGTGYTDDEFKQWFELIGSFLDNGGNLNVNHPELDEFKESIFIDAYSLYMGKRHEKKTIRGNCQGECHDIIYPVDDYSSEAIRELEARYFNTGIEWTILLSECECEEPHCGCSNEYIWHYDYKYTNLEEALREVAIEYFGDKCKGVEVEIWEFGGYHQTPYYSKI